MLESINRIVFGVFLLVAAWEDGREKSIPVWLFVVAGAAGIVLCFLREDWNLQKMLGCMIGVGLLGLSYLTEGGIGKGDGWFFIVSGLFLSLVLNLKLLTYGAFFNGIVCGGIYLYGQWHGENFRKKAIPFVPFLVPVWFGLVML